MSFEKVESAEIRDIIDTCTRLDRTERPGVKELLAQEFFAEDVGLKLELVSSDEILVSARTPCTWCSALFCVHLCTEASRNCAVIIVMG